MVYKLPSELRDMWSNVNACQSKLEMWITNHQLKEKLTARAFSLSRMSETPRKPLPFIKREGGIVEEAVNIQLEEGPDQAPTYLVN